MQRPPLGRRRRRLEAHRSLLADDGFVEDDPETEAQYRALARGGMSGAMSSAPINDVLVSAKAGPRPPFDQGQVCEELAELRLLARA